MRSVLAGLRNLVVPWGATGATPRTVLGQDDPAVGAAGLSSGLVLYQDDHTAYVLGVNSTDIGAGLYLVGLDKTAGTHVILLGWPYGSQAAIGGKSAGSAALTELDLGAVRTILNSQLGAGAAADTVWGDTFLSVPRGLAGDAYTWTGGTGITSTGAEVALGAWSTRPTTPGGTITFRAGRIYRLRLAATVATTTAAPTVELSQLRIRRAVASTAAATLGLWRVPAYNSGTVGPSVNVSGFVQNATTADILVTLGVTLQRLAGTGSHILYGDTATPLPCSVTCTDVGAVAQLPNIAGIATAL